MPLPAKNLVQKVTKSGPKPSCECMKCKTCLARIRQRKHYNENRMILKTGKDETADYNEL